jgi:hypothetical protein
MKDPYAVLLQKEHEMQRVRSEVEALRSIVPLLSDEASSDTTSQQELSPADRNRWPLQMK